MSMNKKNFLIGMGIGLVVGDAVGMLTRPKKCASKNTLGKALRTMSDVADTISGYMGWYIADKADKSEKNKKSEIFFKNPLQFWPGCAIITKLSRDMRR